MILHWDSQQAAEIEHVLHHSPGRAASLAKRRQKNRLRKITILLTHEQTLEEFHVSFACFSNLETPPPCLNYTLRIPFWKICHHGYFHHVLGQESTILLCACHCSSKNMGCCLTHGANSAHGASSTHGASSAHGASVGNSAGVVPADGPGEMPADLKVLPSAEVVRNFLQNQCWQ